MLPPRVRHGLVVMSLHWPTMCPLQLYPAHKDVMALIPLGISEVMAKGCHLHSLDRDKCQV